jgi:CDP-glycerol glycerophosphotransferase
VIVVDDASTDETPRVAAELMESDPRVRYLRRPANSGGCGAPRNDGLDAAAAPYLMYLDSDDELPRHACKSLLTEIERTGVDFVSGQISRLYESSGRLKPYYPTLFARRRVVAGIGEEPELFLDSFTTNKLYDVRFLRDGGLRFPEEHPAARGLLTGTAPERRRGPCRPVGQCCSVPVTAKSSSSSTVTCSPSAVVTWAS